MSIFFGKIFISFYFLNLNFYNDGNLISDQTIKIGVKMSCILKIMNFVIFRDFCVVFLNFF